MENAGIFCGHLEYFTVVWYILWPFCNVVVIWYFSLVLVYCVEKNLATLISMGNYLLDLHTAEFFQLSSHNNSL
jgi:hypothetical protein